MDRFIINYNGNKYNETKKYLKDDITDFNYDYVLEPFGGIFGFSRYYYLINQNKKTKFLINDIDNELIDFYNSLKNDFDKTIKYITDFVESDDYKKFSCDSDLTNYLRKSDKSIIKNIFRGRSAHLFGKEKGEKKIKNFITKKEDYKELFKRFTFSCMDVKAFLREHEAKKNKFIYFDPPYFNSCNEGYQDIHIEEGYHDGTSFYIDILNEFKANNGTCMLVLNEIALINYLFKDYIYKKYDGKYQNAGKKIKRHIIFCNK